MLGTVICLMTALAAGERYIPGCQGTHENPSGDRIEVTTKTIRVNGEPKVFVMGEMHYARVPETEWTDYIRKMKAGGVSIVASYVFWNMHEEREGVFDWTGRRNLDAFLSACETEQMPVVLRIGPWAHGEVHEGGLPDWVVDLRDRDGVELRSADPRFLAKVGNFWRAMFPQVEKHLFKNGGCVIGCQLENECRGPWPYMMALKKLAVETGFDVPFYTRTGWPAMKGRVDYGEILPLYGDYADGFWERRPKISPNKYGEAFVFKSQRTSANIANEQIPAELLGKDDQSAAMYPYLTCELGGGMASSYHHRLVVFPMDAWAMAIVKLGSGSNMLGYYMYAGGTNPNLPREGVFFNERQSGRFTNHNDLPPFSYEFYSPVSEFGETPPHYRLLAYLHEFCATFGKDFALEEPQILDNHHSVRGPFRFTSAYSRHRAARGERQEIPHIFPENWRTKDGVIKRAHAQPIGYTPDGVLKLLKIPGFEPIVEFEGEPFAYELVDFPEVGQIPQSHIEYWENVACRQVKGADEIREVATGSHEVAEQPSEADWDAAAEFEILLPGDVFSGRNMLEIGYVGDCARVYVDGVPVADDFYKGLPMRVGLWRLDQGRVTVRVLPWNDSPLIYVQEPFRPDGKGACAILSLRLYQRPY